MATILLAVMASTLIAALAAPDPEVKWVCGVISAVSFLLAIFLFRRRHRIEKEM